MGSSYLTTNCREKCQVLGRVLGQCILDFPPRKGLGFLYILRVPGGVRICFLACPFHHLSWTNQFWVLLAHLTCHCCPGAFNSWRSRSHPESEQVVECSCPSNIQLHGLSHSIFAQVSFFFYLEPNSPSRKRNSEQDGGGAGHTQPASGLGILRVCPAHQFFFYSIQTPVATGRIVGWSGSGAECTKKKDAGGGEIKEQSGMDESKRRGLLHGVRCWCRS